MEITYRKLPRESRKISALLQDYFKDGNKAYSEFSKYGVALCGGAIAAICSDLPVKDLDLYLNITEDEMWKLDALERAICMNAAADPAISKVSRSDNATTITWERGSKKYCVQIVRKVFGDPVCILEEHFDFTVTMGAFVFSSGLFAMSDRFLIDLAKRDLVFVHSQYPICSLHRVSKYLRKGFTFKGSSAILLGLAIAQLEISSYQQLKEQLMGIDTLLLVGLLESLDESVAFDMAKTISLVLSKINNEEVRDD